jgi:hypothetical protein
MRRICTSRCLTSLAELRLKLGNLIELIQLVCLPEMGTVRGNEGQAAAATQISHSLLVVTTAMFPWDQPQRPAVPGASRPTDKSPATEAIP